MNPLLSLFYSHPLYPISRRERIFVYILSFFFVTIVNMYETTAKYCHICRQPEESWCVAANLTCVDTFLKGKPELAEIMGDNQDRWDKIEQFWETSCCRGQVFLARWFEETFTIGGWEAGGMLYALVLNCVFSLLCFQCMICGCVQSQPRRIRKLGQYVGYALFCVVAFAVLHEGWVWFQWCYVLGGLRDAIRNFVEAKLTSWIGVTFVNIAIFSVLFEFQQPREPGESLSEMDPLDDPEADTRNCIIKLLNPRFNVLAEEYHAYVEKLDGSTGYLS